MIGDDLIGGVVVLRRLGDEVDVEVLFIVAHLGAMSM